jgi:hypothetical protein
MYAMIRRYSGNEALWDSIAEHADEIKTMMSSIAGFDAYYLIRSGADTASVTVCNDQAGVEESSTIAAAWIRENMPGAATVAPQVTAGDVVVHHAG